MEGDDDVPLFYDSDADYDIIGIQERRNRTPPQRCHRYPNQLEQLELKRVKEHAGRLIDNLHQATLFVAVVWKTIAVSIRNGNATCARRLVRTIRPLVLFIAMIESELCTLTIAEIGIRALRIEDRGELNHVAIKNTTIDELDDSDALS